MPLKPPIDRVGRTLTLVLFWSIDILHYRLCANALENPVGRLYQLYY